MKTTNYLFVAFGAAALTLTACNNDDDVLNGGQEPGVVNIVTSINGPQTRVVMNDDGSGNFTDGDKIKLEVFNLDLGRASEYDYTIGSTKLYWEDVATRFGEADSYTFGGWYANPLPENLWAMPNFDVAAAEDPDLLLATPATAAVGETVNLVFKHAMHKLAVNVTYDGDFTGVDLNAVTVKPVGMNRLATVNVENGTVTVGEAEYEDGEYAARTLTNNACEFILAPQKLTTGAAWLEINLGGQPLTFNVPANYTTSGGSTEALSQLNSGEVLTLNLTIKKVTGGTDPDKTEIVLTTGQITAWNSQGTVEGEVQVNGNN